MKIKEIFFYFLLLFIFFISGVQIFFKVHFNHVLNDFNNLKNNDSYNQKSFLMTVWQKKDKQNNPIWIIILSVLFFVFIIGKLIFAP